jgi:hypothetical protein
MEPMATEYLPDEQRLLILTLVNQAWVRIRDDPEMDFHAKECEDIIRMLSGENKRITVTTS